MVRKPRKRRALGTVRFVAVHALSLLLLLAGAAVSVPGAFAPSRVDRWRGRLLQAYARIAARVIGLRVVVEGTPPAGGSLLVANHQGYVDILVLASRFPSVFVARGDLARWPLVGWITRSVGTLFVRREIKREIPRVTERMRRVLENGTGVVLFPEGTNTDGTTLLPFKSAFLDLAAREDLPVACAAIHYRTPPGAPPASSAVAWMGTPSFFRHMFELFCLPEFEANVVFGDEPLRHRDRKVLAGMLQAAIRERLPLAGA